VVAKDVMPTYIGPSGLILVRVAGAVACFWALHTFYPRTQLERKDIPRIIACGFFGVALNQLLFFIGLDMSTPINAAIIMTSNPIIVLCMAAIMLGILLTIKKSLGML